MPQTQTGEKFYNDFSPVSYEAWKQAAEKALKGAPFERKMFTDTYEGIQLKPIYRAEDAGPLADTMPGGMPFIRSANLSGYIESPWLISQECNTFAVAEANTVLLQELAGGVQDIHLKLDNATRLCLDPDMAQKADTGGGISLYNLDEMQTLLTTLQIDKIPLRVYTGATAIPFLGLLTALAKKKGIPVKALKGAVGADPLGCLAQTGQTSAPLEELYRHMAAAATWAIKSAPDLRTVFIDISPYHNAGANAVQEVAVAAATAVEYIRRLSDDHLRFADICSQIQFVFSTGANLFMEIAKLRAFRLVWSQIGTAYGEEENACAPNVHVRTSYFTKTVYDPYVNLLRATTEAFAGAMGGVDSMQVGSFDETVNSGDNFSRRLARNIQIMLQNECQLLHPIDPSGGSWYIENLTENIARTAWETFQKLEETGGLVNALREGSFQNAVHEVFKNRQTNLAKRKDVLVGTNMYANLAENPLKPDLPVNVEKRKLSASQYKQNRDSGNISSALTKLHNADIQEIIEAAGQAATAGCTLGEIYRAALHKSGPESIPPLVIHRNAERFEEIRRSTEEYHRQTGTNIRIFSANMGPIPKHKARADFARGFFEVGGFEVMSNDGFNSPETAAEAAASEKPDAVVICSTDEIYTEVVPALAALIKKKLPDTVLFLAGRPSEDLQTEYKKAGVDGFIYMGADCTKILKDLQKSKGII